MKYINAKNLGIEKAKRSMYLKNNSLAFAIKQVKQFLNNDVASEIEDITTINKTLKTSTISNSKSIEKVLPKKEKYIHKWDLENPELSSAKNDLSKYWIQRYNLFSRFDEGIQMDEGIVVLNFYPIFIESWYSVTHEHIAKHLTKKSQNDTFIDICCGVGSTCIQAANSFLQVFGIDNDIVKLEAAKNNANIYGVASYIDFILGDYFDILKTFRRPFIDVIYIDLPWGGPEYLNKEIFDCMTDFPLNLEKTYNLCLKLTENVIIGLPRNTSLKSIGRLLKGRPFEVEKNFMYRKLKRITVYTGSLLNDKTCEEKENQLDNVPLATAPPDQSVQSLDLPREDSVNGEYLCEFEETRNVRKRKNVEIDKKQAVRRVNTIWNL